MIDKLSAKIRAIATCVPPDVEPNSALEELFGERNMRRFEKSTGIAQRRIATNCTALDLSVAAAERLRDEGHDIAGVKCVVFVSQTPDYVLPCSAAIAQHRLGVSTGVAAFDIGLGCSGYTYGLWAITRLLAGSGTGLLLVGDTSSTLCASDDRSTRPIFGDAGSATLIEADSEAPPWTFLAQTDGSGAGAIIVPDLSSNARLEGGIRPEWIDSKLYMDGGAVFNFATNEVPDQILRGLEQVGWGPEQVDHMFLHQANSLILKTIARKTNVDPASTPSCIAEFGNTSCTSIPLAITQHGKSNLGKTVLSGFGVGLSWATILGEFGPVDLYHGEFARSDDALAHP